MGLRAGDLIDRAKLMAQPTGFTTGVSPTQLLAHLTNLDNDLIEVTNQIMPSLISTSGGSFTITASGNSVGYDLEPATGYTDFTYIDSNDKTWEIYVVMEVDFIQPSRHPSCMLTKGIGRYRSLIPADPMGKAWEGDEERQWWKAGDRVTYRYIPLPTVLEELDDELQAPEFAQNYLVQSCASLILQMLGADPAQVQMSAMREQNYYKTFLMQLYKQARIHTPNQVNEDTFWYTNPNLIVR